MPISHCAACAAVQQLEHVHVYREMKHVSQDCIGLSMSGQPGYGVQYSAPAQLIIRWIVII